MEHLKTYRETLTLRTPDCDFTGFWRPSAILTAMQETAGVHSSLLGCGRDALLKNGIVWVLTRCEVRMDIYPQAGDTITVETFPAPLRRWFFPRYYVFRNDRGGQIGCAATLWVLLKLEDRKMAPPEQVGVVFPDNSDLTPPMGLPGAVEDVHGKEKTLLRAPRYSDLDVNQHVNNTRYADWACDALGVDVMRDCCLENMRINFAFEVRPDQEMTLKVNREGPLFRVAGYHEDRMHFEVGGTLKKR